MLWGTAPLWGPAQEALKRTISRQAQQPNTNFTIVAFKDKSPIPKADILTFEGKEYNVSKQLEIDSLFDREIKGEPHYTNIESALRKGFSVCNPAMENRIYLLTDGKHNCPDAEAPEKCINAWCANHPKGSRLFYVMMSEEAAADKEVLTCVEACDDGYVVICRDGVIPQIVDIGSHVVASTYDLNSDYAINFSEPIGLPVNLVCDDPAFEVKLVGGGAADGKIRMQFVPKGNFSLQQLNERLSQLQAGENYEFELDVNSADKDYIIANPKVSVTMKNLPPRKLQIFGGETKGLTFPEVRWHDQFLWNNASPDQPVEVDFSPVFESLDDASVVIFSFQEIKDNPVDYVLTYNDRQLRSGENITLCQHDAQSKLTIHFNHDAKEGDRAFTLIPVEIDNIDIINDMSAEVFPALAVNLSYDVYWNPLKTACFWLVVILIAALLIWLLMVKPAKYPKMDVASLQIVGTGGVYINKKIRGCRQVVLTNRKRSQNAISRLFSGKVMYITNAGFTSDIRIERSAKRTVRFYVYTPWGIAPTTTLRKNGSAKLKNMSTGAEYTVNIF